MRCLNRLDDLKPEDDNGFITSSTTNLVPQTPDLKGERHKSDMPGPGSQLGGLYPNQEMYVLKKSSKHNKS